VSAGAFAVAIVRVTLALCAAGVAGHRITKALGHGSGAVGRLAAIVTSLSLILVCSEVLGIVGDLRTGPLIGLLVVVAAAASVWDARARMPAEVPVTDSAPERSAESARPRTQRLFRALPLLALTVTGAQWLLATANALGGGMFNFDTLWYHMPFAGDYALSGSITAIHFTQADPWVAYYPANSELFHAVGIVLLHGDALSPLINLGWLTVLLLGAWCLGRRWGLQAETLVAGCLVAGLPVLASTQPGQAFNDIAGVAMLVAGVALLVHANGPRSAIPAGLALGWAMGTKFTFIVPVFIVLLGVALRGRGTAGGRRRSAALALAVLLTGGWWYLRDLVLVGNPLGTRLRVGPLVLPGPRSRLADASQQTVLSQLRHLSLWGSRFIPGLTHALGVTWPLLLAGATVALAVAIIRPRPGLVRILALGAAAAGLTYLVLPTGAAGIGSGTVLFEVNLRYIAPALALVLLLVPAIVAEHASGRLHWLSAAMALALVLAQAEPSLWPTSPTRHLVFPVLAGALTATAAGAWHGRGRVRALSPATIAAAGAIALAGVFAVAFVVQRHYLQRRYRAGLASDGGLGAIYAWAQTVSHARIALYGSVEQYPLYGALVTNRVDYLGVHTGDGGFAPIADCATWRSTINRDRAGYVVMTPGPTGSAPRAWTEADPAARLILAPGHDAVYVLSGPLSPRRCSSG
jgi:hypothetical protein